MLWELRLFKRVFELQFNQWLALNIVGEYDSLSLTAYIIDDKSYKV